MVVAEQVQHRMDGEETDLPLEGVAVQLGLVHRLFHRDDNVAENIGAGLRVAVVDAVFPHREGQHVGFGVLAAVLSVEFPDLGVVNEADADLRVAAKGFGVQHGAAAAPDQQADPGGNFHVLLTVGDLNLDFFHNDPSPFNCGPYENAAHYFCRFFAP